jgi:hypothetical protein
VPPDEPPLPEDVSTGSEDGPLEPGLELTRLDLSEIVRDSVARASEASPSVIVEVNTPPSLPALGEADALSGVVRLLVDHACRQSDAGVTVKVRRGDEGITVHVVDRGPGLDRENAPDGFDLARTLVAFHGGILWAEPLPAGGTKVAFTIPEEPPTVQGPDLEAATEALRLLDQLSRPGFAVEDPVVLDEPGEWEPEGIASIDLAAITELAAAEAVDVLDPLVEVIEEDAVEVLDPPVEVLEPRTEAPVLEPSEVEVVEDPDEPEPEVVPGGTTRRTRTKTARTCPPPSSTLRRWSPRSRRRSLSVRRWRRRSSCPSWMTNLVRRSPRRPSRWRPVFPGRRRRRPSS